MKFEVTELAWKEKELERLNGFLHRKFIWTEEAIPVPTSQGTAPLRNHAKMMYKKMSTFLRVSPKVDISKNYMIGNTFLCLQDQWHQFYKEDLIYNSGWGPVLRDSFAMGSNFPPQEWKDFDPRLLIKELRKLGHLKVTLPSVRL